MTKSERRKARKVAQKAGRPLTGELSLDRGEGRETFTETRKGYDARYKWAQRYDALNGAPEGGEDR